MNRFAVVGCQECQHHWIVENLRDQDTVQCPRCEHTRRSHLVRARKDTDDWHIACELRSRLLAQRAGELDTFTQEVDDYGVLEDQINFSTPSTSTDDFDKTPLFSDAFAEEADEYLEKQAKQRRDILSDEVTAYFDRRWATPTPKTDTTTDRSLDTLENGNGTIIASEQTDVTASIRVRADCSPADLWQRIATTNEFQATLIDAVRELLADTDHLRPAIALDEAGVTAADGGYARLVAGLDRGPDTEDGQPARGRI